MNHYKVQEVMKMIQRYGKLPVDAYGQTLSAKELLMWFGLNKYLASDERSYVEYQLKNMIEIENAMTEIKQNAKVYSE